MRLNEKSILNYIHKNKIHSGVRDNGWWFAEKPLGSWVSAESLIECIERLMELDGLTFDVSIKRMQAIALAEKQLLEHYV